MSATRVAYRSLLRNIRSVFSADTHAVATLSAQAQVAFRMHADEKDPTEIGKRVAEAIEAADFLGKHVVQARLNESGRYEMALHSVDGSVGAGAAGSVCATDAAAAATDGNSGSTRPSGGCCGGGCR